MVGPAVGLMLAGSNSGTYSNAPRALMVAFITHIVITLVIVYGLSRTSDATINAAAVSRKVLRWSSSKVILILIVSGIGLIAVGDYQILFGTANRGEVRVGFGYFGFLYTWIMIYLVPAVTGVLAFLYVAAGRPKTMRLRVVLTLLLALICGFLSGYKFAGVLVLLPALTLLLYDASFVYFLVLPVLAFAVVVGSGMAVEKRDFAESVTYGAARATLVAAYGISASWNEFADHGAGVDALVRSGALVFGAKAVTLFTGIPENSVEFLKFNPVRNVTYLTYPDADAAAAGTVNLTLTNFGEAVYFFGSRYYWIWSVLGGLLLGTLMRQCDRACSKGHVVQAVVVLTFFYTQALSWINSGGWYGLVGIPTLIGTLGLYVFLKLAFPEIRLRIPVSKV